MSIRSLLVTSAILCAALYAAIVISDDSSATPGLGQAMDAAVLTALPAAVFADGTGLPEGEGDAVLGEQVYERDCIGCHGREGMGGSALELVGDRTLLNTEYPDKGIAVYWPYGPPLFDYIKRSMPPAAPYSLSNDEVYAVIAYLFERSELLEAGATMNASALSSIVMPNRDNFTDLYPASK